MHPDVSTAHLVATLTGRSTSPYTDPAIQVQLLDEYGSLLSDSNAAVTASLATAPARGKITGHKTIHLVGGAGAF